MGTTAQKTDNRTNAAQDTRLRILQAAENVFAQDGYNGASMRAISQQAGVASGLLHYHFDTKENLYAAIVGWRAKAINAERLVMLRALPPGAGVPEVLTALFRPALGQDAGGAAYARIMARMLTADTMHQELVRHHYDATARIFIGALQKSGGMTWEDAAWGYNLAIHVLVSGMARSGRAERLVGDQAPASADDYLNRLVGFAAGGIKEFAASGGAAET